jgi:hypothetical protein
MKRMTAQLLGMLAAAAVFHLSLNAAPEELSGGAASKTSVEAIRSVPPATVSLTAPTDVNTYGTSVESHITIGWPEFKVTKSGTELLGDDIGSGYLQGAGTAEAAAPVNLPHGAAITGIDFYYSDTNAGEDMTVVLYRFPFNGGFSPVGGITSTGSAGFGSASTSLASPVTVDSNSGLYSIYLFYSTSPTPTLKWRAVRVRYKLQVSSAPAVASFTDVPTDHWAFKYVEALKASGITAGCGASTFCPDSPITRAQMAVFLSSALGLQFN